MSASFLVRRSGLSLRNVVGLRRTSARFQSSTSSGSHVSHAVSGIAGGALVLAASYGIYSFSSAGRLHSGINRTASEFDKYYNEATKKFQNSAPSAGETIDYVKQAAYSYVAFIPGGRGYVDAAFKDLDAIREKHSDQVDEILSDTYKELQKISKGGLSMDTVQQGLAALEKMSERLGSEAGDAMSSILDNHPGLKDKFGGNLDQLKQMGDQYGPQAKEQVEQVWKDVQDVLKGGLNAESINKVRDIVNDNIQKVQKLGDKAWEEGMKQAKPYLDKSPQLKKMVEDNADALKKGNVAELFGKVQQGLQSGKTEDLEKYVRETVDKAKKKGSEAGMGGFDIGSIFEMVPGGGQILPRLSQLKEAAEKHKGEGEQLLKETVDEIEQVLTKKAKKAEELIEQVKK